MPDMIKTTKGYSKRKRLVFYPTLLIVMVLMLEVILRVLYFQRNAESPLALITGYHYLSFWLQNMKTPQIISEGEGIAEDDPVIGFRHSKPGVHWFSAKYISPLHKETWKYRVTIGCDGYRATSEDPVHYQGKPAIWIFGCSYTFGWPLNDQETFPWLIQQRLSDYCIRNLGMGGYGNVQALLQLKQELLNQPPPVVAVFVYNPFHLVRNVAAPSYVNNEVRVLFDATFHIPKASIDEHGKLAIQLIPIEHLEGRDPSLQELVSITQLIFQAIKTRCDEQKIISILAFQTGKLDDPVVQYCAQIGFKIIDMSLDLSPEKYRMLPFDAFHPNAKAHIIYSEKLLAGLEQIIRTQRD